MVSEHRRGVERRDAGEFHLHEVTGLGSFATEVKKARKLKFRGCEIPVMPLESIREEQGRSDARQRPGAYSRH